MALGIVYDINQGGISGGVSTESESFNITHLVTGVTGTNAGNKIDQVKNYMAFLGFEIGVYINSGSFSWLRDIQVVPIGGSTPEPDKFLVTLVYRSNPRQELKIESGATLSQITTSFDKDNNAVVLSYTYPASWPPNDKFQNELITQSAEIDKLVPERTVTFRLREDIDPASIAETYVGKVNLYGWRGGDNGEWMCTGITGVSDNSGVFFDNAYSFQHRVGGFNPKMVFHDSSTGKPPPDVDASAQPNAIKTPEMYDEVDFNILFDYDFSSWA